jgi:hypothetical protein
MSINPDGPYQLLKRRRVSARPGDGRRVSQGGQGGNTPRPADWRADGRPLAKASRDAAHNPNFAPQPGFRGWTE